jgi:hypothetical protein
VKIYVVQKGDTLEEIASKHGMTIDEFRKMNTNLTEETLSQGMKVKVAIGKQPLKRAIPVNERSEGHHQAPAQPAPTQQAPVQQAPVQQAPVQQTPVQQAPEPVQQPTHSAPEPVAEKQPNTSAGTQLAGESTAEYPKILYPKQPETTSWNPYDMGTDPSYSIPQDSTAISPESQGNMGTQVSPATQGGGTVPYYPMGNAVSPSWQAPNSGSMVSPSWQGPNSGNVVSPAWQGPNSGNVVSPSWQGPNSGNVVSPAWQGPNSGNVVSPTWQGPNSGNVVSPTWQGTNSGNVVSPAWQGPNSGNVVSPSWQGPNSGNVVSPSWQGPNSGNAVSPATQGPNMGNTVSPATQGSNSGNTVSPVSQGDGVKPFYPNPKFGGASSQKKPMYPFHPSGQMGQKSPYYPQLQPWNGEQPQYPISHGTVQLNQPFQSGKSAGGKSPLPWSNPQVAGASTKPKATQSAPSKANTGKLSPVEPESTGGYPYPYMPTKAQTGKPCNCGGPTPFPSYGQMPVAGYYGGNQPPRPQPMPYWAIPNASAPIYQSSAGQQNNKKSK